MVRTIIEATAQTATTPIRMLHINQARWKSRVNNLFMKITTENLDSARAAMKRQLLAKTLYERSNVSIAVLGTLNTTTYLSGMRCFIMGEQSRGLA